MKKCLIVDDSHEDRQIAANYLEGLGFVTTQAGDGDEALTMCRQDMPDFILVDDIMPRVDGLEFLKRLHRTRGGKRPVVLFCSGHGDTAALGTAIWEGAAECLIKPFDADLLSFKLHQVGVMSERSCVPA